MTILTRPTLPKWSKLRLCKVRISGFWSIFHSKEPWNSEICLWHANIKWISVFKKYGSPGFQNILVYRIFDAFFARHLRFCAYFFSVPKKRTTAAFSDNTVKTIREASKIENQFFFFENSTYAFFKSTDLSASSKLNQLPVKCLISSLTVKGASLSGQVSGLWSINLSEGP